ncbi:MAG: hypothetical protein LCH70_15910, partial [Proteobacteria bacterium]|nr:hypothetical protein [Pseudomonadota bacterium]
MIAIINCTTGPATERHTRPVSCPATGKGKEGAMASALSSTASGGVLRLRMDRPGLHNAFD